MELVVQVPLMVTATVHIAKMLLYCRCGVSQGIIYLVNLYIHDLPNCLSYSHPRSRTNYVNLTYTSHDISEIDEHMNID